MYAQQTPPLQDHNQILVDDNRVYVNHNIWLLPTMRVVATLCLAITTTPLSNITTFVVIKIMIVMCYNVVMWGCDCQIVVVIKTHASCDRGCDVIVIFTVIL